MSNLNENIAEAQEVRDLIETEVYYGFNLLTTLYEAAANDRETFEGVRRLFTQAQVERQEIAARSK